VKRELGLPTFKEKDAIYTYHFYHLLQRAKNIYLLYNTESEGLDAGEKSRFITQLEVEKQVNHNLSHDIYNAVLPETAYLPMVIPKSEKVMMRLKEIAEKGFSPSALTSYIRNPIQFYFQKILRISEVEEVEEESDEEAELEDIEDPAPSKRENARIRELIAERDAWRDLAAESPRSSRRVEEEALPELDPELEAAIEARLDRRAKQVETVLGKTLDELDEAKAAARIPNYDKVADQVDAYRRKAYRGGQFYNRLQAHKLMVAEGLIKAPTETKKKTIIKKSKPKFAAERKTAQATQRGKSASKDFSKLSLKDKEEKLKDVVF
jgi:hypothetical protein